MSKNKWYQPRNEEIWDLVLINTIKRKLKSPSAYLDYLVEEDTKKLNKTK